jgi:hypothetical protein
LPVPVPHPATLPAFSVLLESSPAFAQVFEGESLLGTTPLRLSIDPTSGPPLPRTFRLRKTGYAPYTIVQGAAAQDTRLLAELSREPIAARPPPSATARVPAATGKKPRPTPSAAPAKPSSDIFMQR